VCDAKHTIQWVGSRIDVHWNETDGAGVRPRCLACDYFWGGFLSLSNRVRLVAFTPKLNADCSKKSGPVEQQLGQNENLEPHQYECT
jgi:hypothetical protein